MHELGIATSILETVKKEASKHNGARFLGVTVRVGELSAVDVDSLTFSWEALIRETDWERLKLNVQPVAWVNRCNTCSQEFKVVEYKTQCPKCESASTKLISGDELEIAYIEVDEFEGA